MLIGKSQTTGIFLMKGIEDVALYNELYRILSPLTVELCQKYPKLVELKQGLRDESRDE